MRKSAIAFLTVLICSAPAFRQDQKKEDVATLIKEYVGKSDEGRRAEILLKLKPFDAISAEESTTYRETIFSLIKGGPKARDKDVATLNHPNYPIRYRIQGADKGEKASLLIFMHGGGADKGVNEDQWGRVSPKRYANPFFGLTVFPRVFDDKSTVGWWEESGKVSIIAMLDELKRTYAVDSNRVYLGGVSMGAWGVFGIGTAEADRFAAIFSEAGGFNPRYCRLANLLHLPFAVRVGEKDEVASHNFLSRKTRDTLAEFRKTYPEGYKCDFKEFAGVGHVLPQDSPQAALKWISQFKRDPYPRKVIWEHVSWWSHKTIFYWLKVQKHDEGMRIEAEVGEKNKIVVRAKGVTSGFTIFLNEKLVSFADPVVVEVNGKAVFSGKVAPSLTALLETIVDKEDPEMYFTARIDIP